MVSRNDPRTLLGLLSAAALLAGCAHLGPGTITVDRFNYGAAVGASWKEQTLLNVVKLRYADLPVFVDVSSIVSGYSLESSVSVLGDLSAVNTLTLGAAGRFTDRPTVTYVPVTGDKFLRGLLTPIEPKNIFFMLQAGYPADFLLGLTVDSVNGVNNRSATAADVRAADPAFDRGARLLRELQLAGAVGMRVEERGEAKRSTAVVFIRRSGLPADLTAKSAEIRSLFNLPQDKDSFTLTYSPVKGGPDELAVKTRSIFQIMTALSSYIDVPPSDRASAYATSALPDSAGVRIHSGKSRPERVFAAVRYRGSWFWVDDEDWATKRAVAAIVLLFSLADTGGGEKLPLITIPAQ